MDALSERELDPCLTRWRYDGPIRQLEAQRRPSRDTGAALLIQTFHPLVDYPTPSHGQSVLAIFATIHHVIHEAANEVNAQTAHGSVLEW